MTSPSHKKHLITARRAKAKNRSGRWLLASALCSFLTLPVVAAEPAVSSSQLKWRPARPALATQSAEPGKIVQTAGTTEMSGPSFLPATPSYNMTAQAGSPFDPAPAFPATPAPSAPGLTPPAPLSTPGLTPPAPLDTPSTVTPPATISPDSLSQPMPPMTSPGLTPAIPMGPSELPAPNLNNSGQMPLPDGPSNSGSNDLMKEDCEKGRADIKNTGLTQALSAQIVNLRYTGAGELPYECTVEATDFNERSWGCLTYTWKASALCHKPLYFEEIALERYGHSWGPICDPFVSAAHFFGTLPILPYKMGVDTPCECQYALGYYRPGNCAPYMIQPFPISARGAAVQAGVVVGAAAALP